MVSTAQDIMDRYGIDQDFAASIESLGNDLGVDPMYLANTMYAESRLDPSIKNEAGSGATGLIQFMPGTAANLGTTTDELSRMTPVEQMEYVRRYFSADNLGAGRLRDLRNDPSQHNVNMAVFLPSMIGKPVDTQIPQEYWRQNGSIRTPADYTRSAEERVNAYVQSNPVDTQTDQMLSQEQPEDSFRPEDDTVPSDTGTVTGDQAEEESGFLDTVGEYVGDAYDTVSEYAGDAYDTASEYVGETVDTLERVAESVGDKLRRLLGSEEEQQSSTTVDNPPIPERRPVAVDEPPVPEPRPDQTEEAFSAVEDFVGTLKKAEGGSVEKEVEFIKEEDDDDVPDPPPGATPEEVADDIPAYLSTGEYVLPANVVRFIGLKNITDMHQRALAELQQMEDLDIIENVDENGYVEEDDDEMDYMKPEGVVEIVVAEHHPKGLMAMGFAEGGMIEGYKYVPGVGYRPENTAVTELQESAGDLGEYVSGVGFVRPPESDDRPMPSQKSSQADAKAEAIVSILDGIHSVYDENEGVTTQQFFGKDEEGNLIGPDDPRTQEQLFKLSEAAGRQTFGIIQGRGENSDMAPRDKGITRFLRNVTGPSLPGRVISDEYLAKGLAKLKKDIPEKVYEREDVTGKFYNPEDPQDIFSGDLLKGGDTGPARNAMTLSPEGKSLSVADMMAASIGKEYAQQGRSDTPGGGNTQFGGAGVKSYPGTQAGWKAFTSDVSQGFKDLGSFMTFGGLATTIGKGLMNAFNGRQTFTSVGNQGLPASIAKGGFVTKQGIMRPRSCD